MGLWLLCCAALCVGCSSPAAVPAPLLTCRDAPAVPVDGTQRDVAHYVIDLHAAWADCYGRLGRVRELVGG